MLVEMGEVIKLADQVETLAAKNEITEINQLLPLFKLELQKGLKALTKARIELRKGEAA